MTRPTQAALHPCVAAAALIAQSFPNTEINIYIGHEVVLRVSFDVGKEAWRAHLLATGSRTDSGIVRSLLGATAAIALDTLAQSLRAEAAARMRRPDPDREYREDDAQWVELRAQVEQAEQQARRAPGGVE